MTTTFLPECTECGGCVLDAAGHSCGTCCGRWFACAGCGEDTTPASIRAMNVGHAMIEAALFGAKKAAPAPAPRRDCTCAECGALFELPALGVCPKCSSRQVRRANERETTNAVLAELLRALVEDGGNEAARSEAREVLKTLDAARAARN